MSMSGSQTSFGLWIINKAGGLIYSRTYADGLAQLNSNDYLILASTFHSIHAIASRISPVPGSSGVETIEAETFKMTCLQTPTGIKFVLLTTPSHPSPETVLRRIYETYADHLKDPFYTVEMPIRSETFDSKMHVAVDKKLAALPISIAHPPVPRASSPSPSSSFSYLSPARLPPRRPTPPPPLDGKDLDDVPLTPRFTLEDPSSPTSPTPSRSSCAPSTRPPPRARGEDSRWSNSSFGTARVWEQKAGESARTFKTQAGNTLTIQSKNPYLGRI